MKPRFIARELDALDLGSSLLSSEQADVAASTANEDRRLLWQVLTINLLFFAVEIVAGSIARSMGLVADSLDMLADSAVYGLALYAVAKSARLKRGVATISGILQLLLAMLGLAETARRFLTPQQTPDFVMMIAISFVALAGNATCLYLLQKSRNTEAHLQASMIFTSNDVIANAGVIVAGALVLVTRSKWPDLVAGVAIFLLVARGAIRILRLGKSAGAAS